MIKTDMWRILFPERCPLCDTLLRQGEKQVCASCRTVWKAACLEYRDGFAPFPYEGVYRDAVRRFKYSGRAAYAGFFADAILTAGERRIRAWDPDWIVPVPIHAARRRERGYNQAEEIARALSKKLQIPCRSPMVCRRKKTVPQNGLTPEERRRNLKDAFSIGKERISGRILLVDDIYTTGSTAAELIRILTAHGAEDILVVSVCVALS